MVKYCRHVNRLRPSCVRPLTGDQTKNRLYKGGFPVFGRDEATRTPDPYVPNVVRYQLRYIPIHFPKHCFWRNAAAKVVHFYKMTKFFFKKLKTNTKNDVKQQYKY